MVRGRVVPKDPQPPIKYLPAIHWVWKSPMRAKAQSVHQGDVINHVKTFSVKYKPLLSEVIGSFPSPLDLPFSTMVPFYPSGQRLNATPQRGLPCPLYSKPLLRMWSWLLVHALHDPPLCWGQDSGVSISPFNSKLPERGDHAHLAHLNCDHAQQSAWGITGSSWILLNSFIHSFTNKDSSPDKVLTTG